MRGPYPRSSCDLSSSSSFSVRCISAPSRSTLPCSSALHSVTSSSLRLAFSLWLCASAARLGLSLPHARPSRGHPQSLSSRWRPCLAAQALPSCSTCSTLAPSQHRRPRLRHVRFLLWTQASEQALVSDPPCLSE